MDRVMLIDSALWLVMISVTVRDKPYQVFMNPAIQQLL